jgi:DNA polymerase
LFVSAPPRRNRCWAATFRVTQHRGESLKSPLAPIVMATVHPSSILRAPDEQTRHTEMQRFIADLKKIAQALH